ncbi:MAG: tol-pal system protein YbgF [Deltaproteobacteria bacterium]|nr:tol-pal system protein YbgF [Deltaproteobacteria bacterium]
MFYPIMRRIPLLAGGLFFLMLTVSCVTSREDLIILNDRISAVDRRVDSLEQSTDKRLSQEVDAKLKTIYGRQAEMGTEIESIRRETQGLTGRVEENNHLIKRTVERDTTDEDAVRAQIAELTERIEALEAQVELLGAKLEKAPSAPAVKAPAKKKAPKAEKPAWKPPEVKKGQVSPEQKSYEKALAAFKGGKYGQAISQFKGFLGKYPRSDLADNAQFWIGECHMSLKQYEQAILAYQEVIKKHPKGNKVPNAMLRQAVAFAEIKDKTSAKLLLKKVIKEYPNSSEARIARAKLKTL